METTVDTATQAPEPNQLAIPPEPTTAPADPIEEDFVVLAKDPEQLARAQVSLIGWMEVRIGRAKEELNDAEEGLRIARERKWKITGWQKAVTRAQERVHYYEKAKLALEAGYCIVPDFPVSIFAVRTSRRIPRSHEQEKNWGGPKALSGEPLAPGQGQYVDPHPFYNERLQPVIRDGKEVRQERLIRATGFDLPDFPLKAVKPQILDATGKAIALGIFDELGVLPNTGSHGQRQRLHADPMVIGRIVRKEGNRRVAISFLVSWWIDTRDL